MRGSRAVEPIGSEVSRAWALMVSIWWVVAAFVLGGWAGMLIFALMSMSAHESDRAAQAEDAAVRGGLGPVDLDPHWGSAK